MPALISVGCVPRGIAGSRAIYLPSFGWSATFRRGCSGCSMFLPVHGRASLYHFSYSGGRVLYCGFNLHFPLWLMLNTFHILISFLYPLLWSSCSSLFAQFLIGMSLSYWFIVVCYTFWVLSSLLGTCIANIFAEFVVCLRGALEWTEVLNFNGVQCSLFFYG